jgi:hypothetical protein
VCVCVCECVYWLLVLDSVTSTPQWIRQPKPRDVMHDVCVFVCKCVLGSPRASRVSACVFVWTRAGVHVCDQLVPGLQSVPSNFILKV